MQVKTHPGYELFTPVGSWDKRPETKPRVLTYVKRGPEVVAHEPESSRKAY